MPRILVGAGRRGPLLLLFALAMVGLAALASCSGRPDEQARKQVETLRSWAAATAMATRAWTAGRVPTPYATSMLGVASREVSDAGSGMRESAGKVAGGAEAMAVAHALGAHVDRARAAIEARDAGGAALAAGWLAGDDSALASIDRRLEARR